MNKRLRLPLALALALGSAQALGLGLGQIEVRSGLNEPLQAEIPVVGTAGETEALQVRLASPDAFARVGLDRPATLAANLAFDVAKDPRGRTVIRVSTPSDVVEPFLTFLLEVDWGRGRMLREYTVLLDSPTMAPIQGAPAATTPITDSEPMQAEVMPPPPPSTPEPVSTAERIDRIDVASTPSSTPEPAPAPAPSAPAYGSDSYGPVASGETLWSIAARTRPDNDISVNQMMVALLRANPDAFIGNNINRLRSGAVLRIPGREDAVAVAAAEAAAQVRDQTNTWRDAVQPAPQPATDTGTTGLVEPATSSLAGADSRLELTPPSNDAGTASATQSGASSSGEGRELRADLARTREEVGTLTQENVELKSRVGELEKMQSDSARLIELKNSELAAAQRRLAELEAQAGVASTAAAPAVEPATPAGTDVATPGDDVAPVDGTAAVEGGEAGTLEPAVDAAAVDPAATVAGTDPAADPADTVTPPLGFEPPLDPNAVAADAAPASTPVPLDPAAPATPPAAEPMPERPPQTPWYLNPWILGGGGLALVALIALLAGRRRAAAKPAPSRYDSDALAASVAAAQAGGGAASIDAADREGELIEAISRDPTDLQRHLDLVRHYYDTGDAAGFESAAEAMYSRVYDPEDDAWQEVLALGQEIAPEHPLFVSAGAMVADNDALDADRLDTRADADLRDGRLDPVPHEPVAYAPSAAPADNDDRDIAWDLPPATPESSTTRPLSFDEPSAPPPLDDFTYDSPSDTYAADLGDADDGASDAAATKLELARAYLDMGDVEGARGMLEEVLNEGSTAQRNDARRLLDEIR